MTWSTNLALCSTVCLPLETAYYARFTAQEPAELTVRDILRTCRGGSVADLGVLFPPGMRIRPDRVFNDRTRCAVLIGELVDQRGHI